MPISGTSDTHTEDYWSKHFSYLKQLIEENGKLEARQSGPLRGEVIDSIISDLLFSPIVVADLTDMNPNVYWELGVRHSLTNRTIMIAEHGKKPLPFDLGHYTILFYHEERLKEMEFRRQFREALEDCLVNPCRPDSPVLNALSGRGSLSWRLQHAETLQRLDALLSELNTHKESYGHLQEIYERHPKHEKLRTFPAFRFRTPATELLITHRHVEGSEVLYDFAETYYENMIKTNESITLWPAQQADVEKYLSENLSLISRTIDGFIGLVKSARQRVSEAVA